MLANGVIKPSTNGWSSLVVMEKNANNKYMFYAAYWKVNAVPKVDAYPLSYMDTILWKLRNTNFRMTFNSNSEPDLSSNPEKKPITASTFPGLVLFQFKQIPSGLSSARASLQNLIDDVIIATENFEEHVRRTKEAGLTINPKNLFSERAR